MHRPRVGVIRGGPSNEYEISLQTGSTVLNNLSNEKYNIREIFIDRAGNWFVNGIPLKPHEALTHVDVVFNALHGKYGEDGKIQHLLESTGIPFTGSGSFASAIGMNKMLSKEIFKKEKIKTPQYKIIKFGEDIKQKILEVFHAFPLPVIIKPVSSGSSLGITLVKTYKNFEEAINNAFQHDDTVMIEEYIIGKEATCGVINHFRNMDIYSLPPIEIKSNNDEVFDFEAKYNGKSSKIIPGNFSDMEKKEIENLARQAHNILGLRHYSRSDFIIHPHRGVFILETNTLPGLTNESLIPKALNFIGTSIKDFLDHIVQLAISKK